MKTIIAEGTSLESAFNNQLDFELVTNATKAFQKSGEDDMQIFAANYLENTMESAEGAGAYIILREPKKASIKQKFIVDNIINKVVRKWETMINFVTTDEVVVLKYPSKGTTKAASIAKAKELAVEKNTEITIVLTKQVKVGSAVIAKVSKSPDKNTLGRYFFFGVENVTEPEEN